MQGDEKNVLLSGNVFEWKIFSPNGKWIRPNNRQIKSLFDKRRKNDYLFVSLPGMKHLFVCVDKKTDTGIHHFSCFRFRVKHLI